MIGQSLRRVLTLGVMLASAVCAETTTTVPELEPVTEVDGLRLEVAIERDSIAVGDSAAITMRLRNDTDNAVRIDFNSTCQIVPFIVRLSGEIEYPGGGVWGCGAMITSLQVPARGEVTRRLVVRGVSSAPTVAGAALTPGVYRAYAQLEVVSQRKQLRSPELTFVVR
ncbi:MAG: hypothetical protein IT357_00965 [Gemmatimonadaceae bacterium]|nr:hypothetical protein [Gemmatimonadaceae bacterium]